MIFGHLKKCSTPKYGSYGVKTARNSWVDDQDVEQPLVSSKFANDFKNFVKICHG